jgi:hypothetical protein
MKQFIISIIILLGVLGLMLSGSGIMSDKADAESARILEDAIRRATVQCYALEGAYPQSVEYLAENYGIRMDRERYNIFYEGFASNIMPDITVIPKEDSDEK